MSVGILHISTTECGKRGIQVTSTPDVASDSAAEFTVALTLVTTRRLLEGHLNSYNCFFAYLLSKGADWKT